MRQLVQQVLFSGVWSVAQNINITAERVGNTVTLSLGGWNFAASTSGVLTANGALPSVFCPTTGPVYMTGVVVDNSVDTLGMVSVSPQGVISISILGANFAATGLAGWQKIPLTYTTIAL